MRKQLRMWAALVVLCLLPCAAMAREGAAPRAIRDSERMLFEGRDIFAYTSGELAVLWAGKQMPGVAEILRIGYTDNAHDSKDLLGLGFPFGEMYVTAAIIKNPPPANMDELKALPLEQTDYPVLSVVVTDPAVLCPFGVQVGMTLEALQALLPEARRENSEEANVIEATLYRAEYSDQSLAGQEEEQRFLLNMMVQEGKISMCVITRLNGLNGLNEFKRANP